jgi:hypothetical protein
MLPKPIQSSMSTNTNPIANVIASQNQVSNVSSLNSMLGQLSAFLSCSTPECQQSQQRQILENKVKKAKKWLATAPTQLANAQRELLLFQGGPQQYNQKLESDFQAKASKISQTFQKNFQQESSSIQSNLGIYQNLLMNYSNVLELYKKLTKENNSLKKDITITNGVIITNTRKSIYEYEIVDSLQGWYKWIRFFYIIIIIAYVIGLFFLPWEVPRRKFVIVLILLCLYPFFITQLPNVNFTLFNSNHLNHPLPPHNES